MCASEQGEEEVERQGRYAQIPCICDINFQFPRALHLLSRRTMIPALFFRRLRLLISFAVYLEISIRIGNATDSTRVFVCCSTSFGSHIHRWMMSCEIDFLEFGPLLYISMYTPLLPFILIMLMTNLIFHMKLSYSTHKTRFSRLFYDDFFA